MQDQIPDNRSVHFLKFPEARRELFDEDMQRRVARLQKVIELTRVARERRALSLKTPLQTLVVIADEPVLQDLGALDTYIKKELNVREVTLSSDGSKYNVKLGVTADWAKLGKRLKTGAQAVRKALPNLTEDQIHEYIREKRLVIDGVHELQEGDLTVVRAVKDGSSFNGWEVNASDNEALIMLDPTVHEHLQNEAIARDIVNRIQRLRKKAGLVPTDDVRMEYRVLANPGAIDFSAVLKDEEALLMTALRGPVVESGAGVEGGAETEGGMKAEGGAEVEKGVLAEDETMVSSATCVFRLLKI